VSSDISRRGEKEIISCHDQLNKNPHIYFRLPKPELSYQLVLLMFVSKMINDVMGEGAKGIKIKRAFVW